MSDKYVGTDYENHIHVFDTVDGNELTYSPIELKDVVSWHEKLEAIQELVKTRSTPSKRKDWTLIHVSELKKVLGE